MFYTNYHGTTFSLDWPEHTQRILDIKKQHGITHLVGTGVSGIVRASILSQYTDTKLCIVRKKEELSHATTLVENYSHSMKFIIVDDFVESGKTLNNILDTIAEQIKTHKKYIEFNIVYCGLYDTRSLQLDNYSDLIKSPHWKKEENYFKYDYS